SDWSSDVCSSDLQTGERRLRAAPPRAVRAARRAHRWHRSRRAPRSLANAPAKPPARLDLRLLDRRGPRRRYGATLRICPRARDSAREPAARAARRAGDQGDALGLAAVAPRHGWADRRTPDARSVE